MQVTMTMEEYEFLKQQEKRLSELRKTALKYKDHINHDFETDEFVDDKITIDKSVIRDILIKISAQRITEETEIIIGEN